MGAGGAGKCVYDSVPHLYDNASPICTTIGKKRRYKCVNVQMYQSPNVQMYQSPNVQMYQSAILGTPTPYPKLCGVVIIAYYNLYQIVCSPRVADASPICTTMRPPFVPNGVLSEGCIWCNFLHHMQIILHQMQVLPARANTRPKGGVNTFLCVQKHYLHSTKITV